MQYSKILNQNIAINQELQTVTTEDGAEYTRDEMRELTGLEPSEIRAIHKIKRCFKGQIMAGNFNIISAEEASCLLNTN